MSWEDEKCTQLGHSTQEVLWGAPSGAGVARKLEEGQSRPWKDSHASEAGKRRPLQTVAWAGDTNRRFTGTRQRAPAGSHRAWEQMAEANATSDIGAVLLTLGWRGQKESEFCPVDSHGIRQHCGSHLRAGVLKPCPPCFHTRVPFTLYF